jgi:hypothetical protein
MSKRVKVFFIVLSVAFNVAFVTMWFAYAGRLRLRTSQAGPEIEAEVWCPLHQELVTSEDQWREIEPLLKEFQATIGELCRHINLLRSGVIDLVATEQPDLEAIRAKQEEILATKRNIQRLVIAHLLAEKEVLTPEQQYRLFEMLRNRSGCSGPPLSSHFPSRGRKPAGSTK